MADETVKIAEIDIGVDKLVKSTGQVKQEIEKLKKSQRELRKDTDGLTAATQAQLDEYTRTEIELKNLNNEYRASNKVLDAYINIQNQEIRTINQAREANLKLIAIKNDLDTENEDHMQMIKKINAEVDKNTDFIKANSSEYEKTKINIGNYKESIKEAISELGIFGKYQQDINNITSAGGPIINFISTNLKQVKEEYKASAAATYGMSKAQIAAHLTSTTLSAGLKILRLALIATGIGAFVVILGSLVTYLVSTQEGINKVNKVLTPLKEVFGALLGLVQKFGKSIFEAFSNPKQLITDLGNMIKENLINRFTALGDIIRAVLDRDWDALGESVVQAATGVDNLTGKVKTLGDQVGATMDQAWQRGKRIEELNQNLAKTEAAYITQQAALRKEFEQQKKLAEDITKPIAEREAAAARAIQTQQEISKGTIERIKQEAEILRLKQMANDTSDAEKAELARKLAEIDKALEEEAAKTTEAQNKYNGIVKEGNDKRVAMAKEASDKALEIQQQELDLYIAQQGIRAKTLEEELVIAKGVSEQKLAILDAEFKAGKKSKTEYEAEKIRIANEFAGLQAEAAVANAERELEVLKQTHQSKIEDNTFLSEELLKVEQERLAKLLEAEKEFQATKLEQGLITQQEYNDAIAEIDLKNRETQKEILEQFEQDQRDKKAIDLKNRMELAQEDFNARMELEKERLEQQRQIEIENAEKTGADIALINAKYDKQEQDRIDAQKNYNLDSKQETYENFATILGKESAAGKAASVAATTIDTYQAATAAYKAMAGIPVVGPALGAVAAAAAVASGLKTIKQIIGVKAPSIPKAQQGIVMDIGGKRHSQGGTKLYDENGNPIVEAEAGEKMVILKREASRELDALSYLNRKHGGVSLSTPVTYANNGGAVIPRNSPIPAASQMQDLFDYDRLGGVLADKVNGIQAVVPVDSIENISSRNARIVNGASE